MGATARRAAKAFKELIPKADVWVQKKDFVIYVNQLPVGRVFSEIPNHTEVKYQASLLAQLGATKALGQARVRYGRPTSNRISAPPRSEIAK